MDHGVGIEVGGSRSSVLSGRTQIFAPPPRISITSTSAQDPSKWLRSRGRCACPEPNFSKTTSSTGTKIVSATNLGLSFMSSDPPGGSPLRLPRGEIVFYPTGRPSIPVLTREIAALGYEVSGFHLRNTDLRLLLAPEVWHWTVVIGNIILFIVVPVESTDSASDQSGYETEDSPFYDSDNVDPDNPGGGYGYWRRC